MMKQLRLLFTMLMLTLLGGNAWAADTWVKTAPSALQTGDIVVIVDQTTSKAMSNNNGTSNAPTATAVTLSSDKNQLISEVASTLQWEVTVADGSYQFGVADTDNYLYVTSTNNGVRVGSGERNSFTIAQGGDNNADFLHNSGSDERYIGVYNNQDWRCYTSINNNIKACVTTFYKKVNASGPIDAIVTISATSIEVGGTATISGPSGLAMNFESDDESVATVDDEGVVTGVAVGETIITASWAATDNYKAGSEEFTVNVIAPVPATVYEKVTNANQLVAGNQYILVAEDYSKAMGAPGSNIRNSVDIEISDGKVSITDEEVTVLTLGGISGAWTFLASDNNEYLAYSGSSNQVHSNADATADASKWIITSDFQLESVATSGRILKYNSGSPRFACYASGQQTAVLFVKEGSAINDKAVPGFSFSASTAEATLGEEFTAPIFSNPNNVEVTFESSAPSVATVDNNGNVTIVAAGETTITASSAETDDYLAGTASYTLTVIDPNAPGTENNPYTVAQARAAIDAGSGVTGVYATGIVSEIVTAYNSQYGNISYNISADGTTTSDQLQAYRGKSYRGEDFSSEDDIQVGDIVVIYGNLKKYNSTYEFDANNQLVSLERNTTTDKQYTLVANDVEYPFNGLTLTQEFTERVEFSVKEGENNVYGAAEENLRVIAENHENLPLVEGGSNQFYITKPNTWKFTIAEDAEGNVSLTVVPATPGETKYMISENSQYLEDAGIYFDGTTLTTEMAENQTFFIQRSDDYGVVELSANERNADDGSAIFVFSDENKTVDYVAGKRLNMYRVAEAGTYSIILDINAKTVTAKLKKQMVLDGNFFVKVTSKADLDDGAYLIVYEGNDTHEAAAFNGALETLDAASNTIDVTIIGERVAATEETKAAWFIIEEGTLKSASGLYIGKNANSNGLDSDADTEYTNSFDFDADGNAIITASGGCTLRYNYASDQLRFRYYKSGQQPVALYKLTTIESIPVTISSAEYATLYYSDMAFEIPEGVTAQIVTGVSDKSIEFEDLDGIIPAGTGVVLNGAQGTYDFKVVNDNSAAPESNKLKGSDVAAMTEGGDKYYKLTVKNGKAGFFWGAEEGGAFENGANKAYLALSADEAKEMGYYFDGLVTEIRSIGTETVNGEIYTIGGVRVKADKLQKGIYIVNGKKMVVK